MNITSRNLVGVGTALVLSAALSAQAETFTTSATSGKFSEVPWTPSVPVGSADTTVKLTGAAKWCLTNDLGNLTVNSLYNTKVGTLRGDGFTFGAGGSDACSISWGGNTICEVPLSLSGGTLHFFPLDASACNFHMYNGFSGTGKAVLGNLGSNFGVPLYSACDFSGTWEVTNGWLSCRHPDGFKNAAAIYNNSEVNPAAKVYRVVEFKYSKTPITVNCPVYLGTESNAKDQYRMSVYQTTANLKGVLNVNRSMVKIYDASRIVVSGGVKGNQLCFNIASGGSASVETTPMSLTSHFYVLGTDASAENGQAELRVANNACYSFSFGRGTRARWFVDNAIKTTALLRDAQMGGANVIDLNGHDQAFADFSNWNDTGKDTATSWLQVRNSDPSKTSTFTINQNKYNYLTGRIEFAGPVNFVKKGAKKLVLTRWRALDGTLTVQDGWLGLSVTDVSPVLAKKLVLEGGTLDLGGRTWFCQEVVHKGGVVVNGTLEAESHVAEARMAGNAVLTGAIVTRGAADGFSATLAPSHSTLPVYDLPQGTVVYLPFDSEAALKWDRGPSGLGLATKGTSAPVYSAQGRHGGCAYFDGNTWFEAAELPLLLPTGNVARTVGFWVKPTPDCQPQGTMVSWGEATSHMNNSCSLRRTKNSIGFYPWGFEGDMAVSTDSLTNSWNFYVMTWDGQNLRQYWNGERLYGPKTPKFGTGTTDIPKTDSTLHTPGKNFRIGSSCPVSNEATFRFKGWLDDVFILDRAATDAEIAGFYGTGFVQAPAADTGVRVESGTLSPLSSAKLVYHFDSAADLLKAETPSVSPLTAVGSGATFSTDSPFGTGGSLKLDGASYLKADVFPDIPTGNGARTIALWMKPDPTVVAQPGLVGWGTTTSHMMCSVALRNSGKNFGFYPWGFEGTVNSSTNIVQNNWNALVVVWDGTYLTQYFNGVRVYGPTKPNFGTGTTDIPKSDSTLHTPASNFRIGVTPNLDTNSGCRFKGLLDEVAIWDRALSAEEARAYAAVGATMIAPALSSDTVLSVGAGASYDAAGADVTLGGLTGTGTVTARTVTLADGVRLFADTGPLTVNATVVVAGGGTVVPPATYGVPSTWPLLTATQWQGAGNLANWTFGGDLPKGAMFRATLSGNTLVAALREKGMVLFVK